MLNDSQLVHNLLPFYLERCCFHCQTALEYTSFCSCISGLFVSSECDGSLHSSPCAACYICLLGHIYFVMGLIIQGLISSMNLAWHLNLNLMQIRFSSSNDSNNVIATKCCTYYDGHGMYKICNDMVGSNLITATWSFHIIRIVTKKFLETGLRSYLYWHLMWKFLVKQQAGTRNNDP